MSKQEKGLSRRQMLGMAIGLGGFAFNGKTGSVFAQGPCVCSRRHLPQARFTPK